MTKKNSELLKEFFRNTENLKTNGVIKSDRFLGDIGEFIIKNKYSTILSENGRQKNIDGTIGDQKVQIKFSSSPKITNINIGNPATYDLLYLVLSSQSLHFPVNVSSNFVVYRISSHDILNQIKISKREKYYLTKLMLASHSFEIINFEDLD